MNFQQQLQEYLFPLRVDKKKTGRGIVYKAVGATYGMSIPLFIKYLTRYVVDGNTEYMLHLLLIFVGYSLFMFLLRASIKDRGRVTLRVWYEQLLNQKYIKAFIYLDNNVTEGLGTGRAIAIVSKGIDVRRMSLKNGVEKITDITLAIIFTLIILGGAGRRYIIGFLSAIVVTMSIATYFNRFILAGRRARKKVNVSYTSHIVRLIMSKFEVLQSGKRAHEHKKFKAYTDEKIEITASYSLKVLYFFFGNIILLYILVIIGLFFSGLQVIAGTMEIAQFTAMGAMMIVIVNRIRDLLTYYKDISRDRVHIERLLLLFAENKKIDLQEEKPDFILKKGTIEIKHLTYAYDTHTVFSDFSLHIEGGKKTALVGISGGGKSTLAKLIAGYLTTDTNAIYIDGQSLADISLKSYYTQIGFLTQDPSVFDGSIIDNLTYSSDETISEKRLKEIITLTKCDFIREFPHGLDTEIGERGIRLSGGQRQRLAIAKIFLKDPEIVILDEPTSALDSFSEEGITEAMKNLFEGRTVLVIAHRLQTVKQADDIIVLDEGKVIERGTHAELVQHGGSYAKMLELQSGF